MARKRVLKIRMDDAEMNLLKIALEGSGISTAAWARGILLSGIRARMTVILNADAEREGIESAF